MLQEDAAKFCGVLQGDWGYSTVFKDDIGKLVLIRLSLTGKLMFWVMLLMIPSALIIGILAGMREGSRTDRTLSTISITTTATPEYVSGVIFIAVFSSTAFWTKVVQRDSRESNGRCLRTFSASSHDRSLRHGIHSKNDQSIDGRGYDSTIH